MGNNRDGGRNRALAAKAKQHHRRLKSKCSICGNPIDYTLTQPDPMAFNSEHKVPLDRGGKDEISNLAPSHAVCNQRKGKKDAASIIRRSGSLV